MELCHHQIHNHISLSAFIIKHVARLCIVVEDPMLMQSTECGENLVGNTWTDFSRMFQEWSPAVAEKHEVFIHAAVVVIGLGKVHSTETNRNKHPLEVLKMIVYLVFVRRRSVSMASTLFATSV